LQEGEDQEQGAPRSPKIRKGGRIRGSHAGLPNHELTISLGREPVQQTGPQNLTLRPVPPAAGAAPLRGKDLSWGCSRPDTRNTQACSR